MARTVPASRITPLIDPNTRSGVPTTHKRVSRTTSTTIVVPMSGSSMIMMEIRSAPGTSGTSRCFQFPSSLRLRTSRSAPQSTRPSLAISLGCSVYGPSSIHRWAPLIDFPNCGVSTTTSRTKETIMTGYASTRKTRTGSRLARTSNGRPMPTQVACRANTA